MQRQCDPCLINLRGPILTSPDTRSKPLREKLLPQASIRFFMVLIAASAMVMVIYRMAFVAERMWAKISVLLISTIGGCFLVYALLFLIANLFTASTAPIRDAIESSTQDADASKPGSPHDNGGQ